MGSAPSRKPASPLDVLIVDDWAIAPLTDAERRAFLVICDERCSTRSTLLTSQLPVVKWHAQIGDPTVADSILDRLVQAAHRIQLQGEPMRKKKGGRGGLFTASKPGVTGEHCQNADPE